MSDLQDWLENSEAKYRKIYAATQPVSRVTGAIQVYAYHNRHDPGQIPIVCVGSNYGQGKKVEKGCAANLNTWLGNYFNMRDVFEQTSGWKRQWVTHRWSSERFPYLPARDESFFIMTNLCPWLTDISWGEDKFDQRESRDLLNASQTLNQYLHVEELIACLLQQEREFVVVGHGVNENILQPLLHFLAGRDRWLLYANLSLKKYPSGWIPAKQKFDFADKPVLLANDTLDAE